ncbi:MAG: hypothetical protein M2R45_03756 [Verrucomicrobia subdivision 3 bacterium]|nr:hypothetical protein [Limisphaerales bacterium]MCS1416920.1 hypothetical protein [Limisphaerales bacterium]
MRIAKSKFRKGRTECPIFPTKSLFPAFLLGKSLLAVVRIDRVFRVLDRVSNSRPLSGRVNFRRSRMAWTVQKGQARGGKRVGEGEQGASERTVPPNTCRRMDALSVAGEDDGRAD